MYRERHTEYIATQKLVLKFDAKVPVTQLQTFINKVETLTVETSAIEGNLYIFGHLLDGNLHLALSNVREPLGVQDKLAHLVISNNGSIRAEHGIGQAKSRYLSQGFTPGELASRKLIRDRFDPFGVMNPSIG
jgi:FAD/FMN-containing dehydrogenase